MKPALLDVNVLIALIDPQHQFHDAAHAWFAIQREHGWATCPITENGCVRILGKPGYPYLGLGVSEIREILSEFCAMQGHLFWHDSVSLTEKGRFQLNGAGPKNITDIYLLALAARHGGRLATFDRSMEWNRVSGCVRENVEWIGT
jgi:toxin-antitoxin system PIN domain toxin